MTGERNFAVAREDPYLMVGAGLPGRKHERALRVVRFAREHVHRICAQPCWIQKHEQLIALERAVREHIGMQVSVATLAGSLEQWGCGAGGRQLTELTT